MFQSDLFNIDILALLAPVIGVIIILIMMILMIMFFTKKRIFLIILAIHLFSMIIGVMALETPNFPFTPWFQVFFIVFQTTFLLISGVEVYKYGKGV